MPNRCAHHCGGGPAHAPSRPKSASRSRSSTPPPGNTITPAAKSIAACRRIKKTARPDADPASGSRTNITVAAGLGVGGGTSGSRGEFMTVSDGLLGCDAVGRNIARRPPPA